MAAATFFVAVGLAIIFKADFLFFESKRCALGFIC